MASKWVADPNLGMANLVALVMAFGFTVSDTLSAKDQKKEKNEPS